MNEIEGDIREIFRTVKNTEARIVALSRYMNDAISAEGPALYVTGIPGLAVDHEEAPGVRIGRNYNGSIVEVQIER